MKKPQKTTVLENLQEENVTIQVTMEEISQTNDKQQNIHKQEHKDKTQA